MWADQVSTTSRRKRIRLGRSVLYQVNLPVRVVVTYHCANITELHCLSLFTSTPDDTALLGSAGLNTTMTTDSRTSCINMYPCTLVLTLVSAETQMMWIMLWLVIESPESLYHLCCELSIATGVYSELCQNTRTVTRGSIDTWVYYEVSAFWKAWTWPLYSWPNVGRAHSGQTSSFRGIFVLLLQAISHAQHWS